MPNAAGHRCVALVGPYLSGKTSLLEALLFASGTTSRHGSVRDGSSVGDHAPEARARQMSTETNVANATFLGEPWTILDCPGSVELLYEAQEAMLACDVAVVVCEPEVDRAVTVSALLRFLDRHNIPHMIFINKLDSANAGRVRDVLAALQSYSERPLVLRQVPLRGKDCEVTGYVDLVSERAYRYRPGQASDLVPLPEGFWDNEGADAHRPSRKARRFRRCVARAIAGGRAAAEGGNLPAPEPGPAEIADRAGVPRRGGAGSRRAPVMEGAAPRDAERQGDRGAARHRRRRRAACPGDQDLSPAAYREIVARPRLARRDLGRQSA